MRPRKCGKVKCGMFSFYSSDGDVRVVTAVWQLFVVQMTWNTHADMLAFVNSTCFFFAIFARQQMLIREFVLRMRIL